MLTLEQLLRSTDQKLYKTFRKYGFDSFSISSINEEGVPMIQATATIRGGHETRRTLMKTSSNYLNLESTVLVYCDCQYFTYHLEAALVTYGNAVSHKSDGTYPINKNPKFKPGLCPHLVCLAHAILNRK